MNTTLPQLVSKPSGGANASVLADVVKFHIVPGVSHFPLASLRSGMRLKTAQGADLIVDRRYQLLSVQHACIAQKWQRARPLTLPLDAAAARLPVITSLTDVRYTAAPTVLLPLTLTSPHASVPGYIHIYGDEPRGRLVPTQNFATVLQYQVTDACSTTNACTPTSVRRLNTIARRCRDDAHTTTSTLPSSDAFSVRWTLRTAVRAHRKSPPLLWFDCLLLHQTATRRTQTHTENTKTNTSTTPGAEEQEGGALRD